MSLIHLKADNLGPCEVWDIIFGERLTLITGDNSVGKTLI